MRLVKVRFGSGSGSPLQEKIHPQPRWEVSFWRPFWEPAKYMSSLPSTLRSSMMCFKSVQNLASEMRKGVCCLSSNHLKLHLLLYLESWTPFLVAEHRQKLAVESITGLLSWLCDNCNDLSVWQVFRGGWFLATGFAILLLFKSPVDVV